MVNQLTAFKESFFADPKKRAIAALAIALIAFAFVPILVRLAENEITPNAVIFHRLWIASSILGLVKGALMLSSKLSNHNNQPNPAKLYPTSKILLLLTTGIFFVAPQITWAWSLTQTSIANSALLHNFTPIFATIIGFLFFKQRFDDRFIIGMTISIAGSVLLAYDDILSGTGKIQGDIIALLSALFLAIYLLLVKRLQERLSVLTTVLSCCLIGTMTTLPIVLGNTDKILPSSWIGWLAVLGLGWSVVVGFVLMTYALKSLPSEFVAVTLLLDPILTASFAWAIFSETLDLYTFLAFSLILLGIYLSSTSNLEEYVAEQ